MQMYVNYFDRYVKTDKEKPTVGILLCREQNDSVVELTLPKDANIYSSAYSLYLPNWKTEPVYAHYRVNESTTLINSVSEMLDAVTSKLMPSFVNSATKKS